MSECDLCKYNAKRTNYSIITASYQKYRVGSLFSIICTFGRSLCAAGLELSLRNEVLFKVVMPIICTFGDLG